MTELTLRAVAAGDGEFLRSMLYEAAFWRPRRPRPPLREALAVPELRLYVQGWGRDGDRGVVAESGGRPLGAAWYRFFSDDNHGYGFVDASTPELTIAVEPASRGMGVGHALLAVLLAQARVDGAPALSLSVERDNPARRLYQRFGFESVARVGDARTMTCRLAGSR